MHFLVVLFLALGICPAFSQAGPHDETYDQILKDRGAFQRVVFLRGDSILRGYPLGFFPDVATDEQKNNPQWAYRSPASTFNKFAPSGVIAAYGGLSGQPDVFQVEDVARELDQQLKQGIIRSGDAVVFEDAGLQYGSPRDYLKNWLRLRHVFAGRNDITVVFLTIPDRIKVANIGGLSSNFYRFDQPFDGLSHNDATRMAAENNTLVDFERIVAAAEAEGRTPMQEDGIHITVEGQCLFVQALFDKLSIKPTGTCVPTTH